MTILAKLYERQGIPLETDADWAAYEAHKAERRAKNVASAREVLDHNMIVYADYGRVNELVHFVIHHGREELWYYPEIGLWFDINVEPVRERFGVRNLARYITGDETC